MIGGVVTIRFLTVTRPAPQTMWLSPWQISGLRNWVHLVRMFVPRVMRRPAMMTSLVTRFMSDCSNGSLCCTPWSFTDLSYIRTDWLTADLLAPSAAGKVSTCEETWQRERVREYVCGVVWCGAYNMNDDLSHHSLRYWLGTPSQPTVTNTNTYICYLCLNLGPNLLKIIQHIIQYVPGGGGDQSQGGGGWEAVYISGLALCWSDNILQLDMRVYESLLECKLFVCSWVDFNWV